MFLPFLISGYSNQFSIVSNRQVQTINGDHPTLLKTTNGCWDVSHIVINRGDTLQNINGSVGYFSFSSITYDDTIIIADTLPKSIIDASFAPVEFQEFLGANQERYFIVTTEDFIYLYSTFPENELAIIMRVDSIPTHSEYVDSVYNGENQLLVVNKQDSVNYNYSLYSIPDLTSTGQLDLALKPDLIQLLGSIWYLIIGDSLGTQKMVHLNETTQQIDYNLTLPYECKNTRSFMTVNSYNYFISTPGDSITNLIQLNTIDTIFNSINLFPNSGLNDVISYSTFPSTFLLQPTEDTSSASLNKSLLFVDAVLGINTDTIPLGKSINSLHKNTSYGFGPYVYSIIMGVSDSDFSNYAFFYPPYNSSDVDSVLSGMYPSWFGEDYRCYVTIEEVEQYLSINVNPNPATDQLVIQVDHLAKGKTYTFEITNIQGQVLWRKEILAKQQYAVPIQDFPSGILILRVDAGTKVVTRKIVKQ